MNYLIILILLCRKMCFIFPCVMKKPAFATRDESIDKLNLFFLSGRTVSRCRRKRKEKSVPTDRKKKLQILIICENKLLKAELYKSNFAEFHGAQLSLYILRLSIFSFQFFCNSCSFSLFHFLV